MIEDSFCHSDMNSVIDISQLHTIPNTTDGAVGRVEEEVKYQNIESKEGV